MHRLPLWFILFFNSVVALTANNATPHCPAVFYADDLTPSLLAPRREVRLYTTKGGGGNWEQIPIQIDIFRDADRLYLYYADSSNNVAEVDSTARFTLKSEHMQKPANALGSLPCRAGRVYELLSVNGNKAVYLTQCKEYSESEQTFPGPVTFSQKEHLVSGPGFSYKHSPKNYILFQELFVSGKSTSPFQIRNSNMSIKADVKKFFTFYFDSDDIVSELETLNLNALGINAKINFYLQILFFKMHLDLSTDASFYETTAYVPMVLYQPVNAKKYIRPGSAIFYYWESQPSHTAVGDLPLLQTTRLLDPGSGANTEPAKLTEQYCHNGKCTFRVAFRNGNEPGIELHFALPEHLVQKRFFPIFVEGTAKDLRKQLDWSKLGKPETKLQGFIFPTSELPEGIHSWDLWFDFAPPEVALSRACPEAVRLGRVLNL